MPMILEFDTWATPATAYERRRVGRWRVHDFRYPRGYYHMYGLDDALMFQATRPLTITRLQEKVGRAWETWMVDDPPHWRAMQYYASHATGRVLTAGLGLGLVHHALDANPNVTEIVAVEREGDVIDLMRPYLPGRVRVEHCRWEDFLGWHGGAMDRPDMQWDTIIVDLWVAHGGDEKLRLLVSEVIPMFAELRERWPDAALVFHGFTTHSDIKWPLSKQMRRSLQELGH